MQLQHELAGQNQRSKILGRHQLELDARLCRRPV
jgi:hypothetical protein